MATSLRPRKIINYKLLHEGESIVLEKDNKRTVLKESFFVERLIWKRNRKHNTEAEYLVKWQEYHAYDCTWEPEQHLPTSCVDQYIPQEVDSLRLRTFAGVFERAIRKRLKAKSPESTIYADFDVFRYIFGSCTSVLCNLDDFDKLNLPENWYYDISKDGTGRKIKFPLKLSVRLCMRKMYIKVNGSLTVKQVPVERINIYSCTEACTVDDL